MRSARHGEPGRERPLVSGADGLWRNLSRQRQRIGQA